MALSKKPVTGMKDILPEEMVIRDYVIGVIKETYGKFGFTSIETPCVENIENLTNKQGGENEKLIFKIPIMPTNCPVPLKLCRWEMYGVRIVRREAATASSCSAI